MRGTLQESPEGYVLQPSLRATVETFLRWLVIILGISLLLVAPDFRDGIEGDEPVWVLLYSNVQILASFVVPLIPALRLAFTRYTIDNEGIRVRSQLLATQDHRIPWEKVTAVGHRRTLLDRVLGLERVSIISYGVRGATLQLVGLRGGAPIRDMASLHVRKHCSVTALQRGD